MIVNNVDAIDIIYRKIKPRMFPLYSNRSKKNAAYKSCWLLHPTTSLHAIPIK